MAEPDPYLLAITEPDRDDVRRLTSSSDAYLASLYPAESNHLTDIAALVSKDVTFLAALCAGEAVGCGALVRTRPGECELKRMFVAAAHRRRGLARRILRALEVIASEEKRVVRLETGVKQPEAMALYKSAGFVDIASFGSYAPDPLSVFMEKRFGVKTGELAKSTIRRG
jgi:putative acetyltransferase